MNEERDSQLSAMFDGELPAAECELLARRLVKDDGLRREWNRYALISAAVRASPHVPLDLRIAGRVSAQLLAEDAPQEQTQPAVAQGAMAATTAHTARAATGRCWRPAVGAGIAAGVAAASILWLRQEPGSKIVAATTSAAPPTRALSESSARADGAAALVVARDVRAASEEPDRYVTPPPSDAAGSIAPAELANYFVAHSEFSGPLSRRMVLSGLMANEVAAEVESPSTEVANAGR